MIVYVHMCKCQDVDGAWGGRILNFACRNQNDLYTLSRLLLCDATVYRADTDYGPREAPRSHVRHVSCDCRSVLTEGGLSHDSVMNSLCQERI